LRRLKSIVRSQGLRFVKFKIVWNGKTSKKWARFRFFFRLKVNTR